MKAKASLYQTPAIFKLLANDIRWGILTLLAKSDYCGQDLVRLLHQPQNLVSYHLKMLIEQQVVNERTNNADERSIYYSLNFDILRTLYQTSILSLHPGLANFSGEKLEGASMPVRVLFLCTQNSARSQMAEGLLRTLSHGRIEVTSAGSHPGQLHPLAQETMERQGISIAQQRSKHLNEFEGQHFDYVITVCDNVREACPTFPDDPDLIHWSIPDPAVVEGNEQERRQAFTDVAEQLKKRIQFFLRLINRESVSISLSQ